MNLNIKAIIIVLGVIVVVIALNFCSRAASGGGAFSRLGIKKGGGGKKSENDGGESANRGERDVESSSGLGREKIMQMRSTVEGALRQTVDVSDNNWMVPILDVNYQRGIVKGTLQQPLPHKERQELNAYLHALEGHQTTLLRQAADIFNKTSQ